MAEETTPQDTPLDRDYRIRERVNAFDDAGPWMYEVEVLKTGKRLSHVGMSYDEALLIALGHKYLGVDSKFELYAARMLKMDIPHDTVRRDR